MNVNDSHLYSLLIHSNSAKSLLSTGKHNTHVQQHQKFHNLHSGGARLGEFLLRAWSGVGLRRFGTGSCLPVSTDAGARHGQTSYQQGNAHHEAISMAYKLTHKPYQRRNRAMWQFTAGLA